MFKVPELLLQALSLLIILVRRKRSLVFLLSSRQQWKGISLKAVLLLCYCYTVIYEKDKKYIQKKQMTFAGKGRESSKCVLARSWFVHLGVNNKLNDGKRLTDISRRV